MADSDKNKGLTVFTSNQFAKIKEEQVRISSGLAKEKYPTFSTVQRWNLKTFFDHLS